MFKLEMIQRLLGEATESVVETFNKLGPFKTKNSDVPMEIDFGSIEFRNELHINEDDEMYIGQFKIGRLIS